MEHHPRKARQRAVAILFGAVLVNLIGFGIIIPLLPFYGQRFGASELEIGALFASFSIAQVLSSPLWGALSDRYGRKPFLFLALVGAAVGYVIMALAPSLEWLFVARLVDGAFGGIITTVRAYLADVLEESERARGFGLIGAAFGIGFVVGPLLGSALAAWGLSAPAWAAAALSFIAALWVAMGLPEPARHRTRSVGSFGEGFRRLWGHQMVRPFLLFDFLLWSSQAVYQTSFALLVHRRFGLTEQHVGYLVAFAGALGVLTQVAIVGPVARRLGDGNAFWVGSLLAAVGLGTAVLAPSVPLFMLCVVPAALGSGMAIPTLLSVLSRVTPSAYQGSLQGVTTSLEGLARILGPLWGNGSMALSPLLSFGSAAVVLAAVGLAAIPYVQRLPQVHESSQGSAERMAER
ncbi:MAG: MFS transporter [Candidatus Kapabacteria bacterium]|nr:MFS transporter [Candidatus Kapabacteria bacterium]MDW8011745.1 MFS transporter [Bacteroidota bacterium]